MLDRSQERIIIQKTAEGAANEIHSHIVAGNDMAHGDILSIVEQGFRGREVGAYELAMVASELGIMRVTAEQQPILKKIRDALIQKESPSAAREASMSSDDAVEETLVEAA